MELERREYHNHLILQQHHQFARNHMPQPHVESAYYNRSPVQPSVSGRSTISSSPSLASVAQTDTNSWIGSTASNARNARPVTKSPTGWSGRASQRFTNPISDAIIDDACNLDLHPRVPVDVVIRVVGMIKAFYEAPKNKGAGASQAIMAVMYVSNLEDPAYVRRSMEVLDILYKYGGPIFAQNLSLNLDFYQHFLETRKHRNQEEKENISFLCSLFAGWYLLVPSFDDLAHAGNMADPTLRVKQFFEGLVRANYPFPIGSLNHIPAEKMASITAWSLLRGGAFSFATYRH
ncbi:hypothetical protein BC830DRAFT_1114428 [Chytriomyces sp. MP71]|nr:hypothetical protein BC830DRAFT_1127163 [Chytriomyces sp. MP71]KAI8617234.1 hypothetical protein BC830DRAFT_1114428 [Chytriomyces sp. MP71]